MRSLAGDIPQAKSNPATAPKISTVSVRIEPDGPVVKLDGRAAWMMRVLIQVGPKGVTTLELPTGVRVSHYILLLRKAGFIISSAREAHGGPFPSSHSRYRLETVVTIVDDDAVEAAA